MKACQIRQGAKFGKKYMVAAEVNDKAIRKFRISVRIRQRLYENRLSVNFFSFWKSRLSAEISEPPELSIIMTDDSTIGKLTV